MRKATLLSGTISIWAVLIFIVEGDELTWDLSKGADAYSNMLADLRKQVQGTTSFEIPVINKNPKKSYIKVDIKDANAQTFRVALKATDLYVVGYADMDPDTKKPLNRAFVLKPQPQEQKKDYNDAFVGAKVIQLPYTGTYQNMEANGDDRRKLPLTKRAIQNFFRDIYGQKIDKLKKRQAEFLITAIQMISEAARFKYIEEQVKSHYEENHFRMDTTMYDIVTKWDKISKAFALANACKKNVALLNYIDEKCTTTLSLQHVTSEWPLSLAHTLAQA